MGGLVAIAGVRVGICRRLCWLDRGSSSAISRGSPSREGADALTLATTNPCSFWVLCSSMRLSLPSRSPTQTLMPNNHDQDMLIKNARNRSRKWVAERMDMLGKATSKPLRDIIRQYKHQLPILHPFEATLADLTVRAREKTGERTLQVSTRALPAGLRACLGCVVVQRLITQNSTPPLEATAKRAKHASSSYDDLEDYIFLQRVARERKGPQARTLPPPPRRHRAPVFPYSVSYHHLATLAAFHSLPLPRPSLSLASLPPIPHNSRCWTT